MGQMEIWKVLDGIIAELRAKGITLPENIMNDLKSARTLIKMSRTGGIRPEDLQRIGGYLANVESYIISEAEKTVEASKIDEWLKQIQVAGKTISMQEQEESRFVAGAPRYRKWIRIQPTQEMTVDRLRILNEASELKFEIQKDGSLLVYGEDTQLKDFVKKLTAKYRSSRQL